MAQNIFGLRPSPDLGQPNLLIAVVTSQPFSLFDGETCLADSIPPVEFALATDPDAPRTSFFGRPTSSIPRFVGGKRPLTAEELACDGIVATGAGQAMIEALRAAGFRGAIFAPGKLGPRPDGLKDAQGRIAMTAFVRGSDGLYESSPALD